MIQKGLDFVRKRVRPLQQRDTVPCPSEEFKVDRHLLKSIFCYFLCGAYGPSRPANASHVRVIFAICVSMISRHTWRQVAWNKTTGIKLQM